MSSREGRKQWAGELPVEVIDAVKEESKGSDRAMWEIFNEATKMFLGLEDASTEAAVKRHIDRLEGEVDTLRDDLEQIEDELSTKEDRLAEYRDKLDEIQDQKESYEQRLDNILADLEANTSKKIIAHRKEIRSLATDHHGKPSTENREAVKEDLWQRAMDQQRDVSRHQFSESMRDGSPTRAATDGSGSGDNVPRAVRLANQQNEESDDSSDADEADDSIDRGDGVMTDGGVDVQSGGGGTETFTEQIIGFYRTYYEDEIALLAQNYPEQSSLTVDWRDVYQWNNVAAEDVLDDEAAIREYFEEALRLYDLPADINLNNASVRFTNLGSEDTYHCNQLRADKIGRFLGVKGQVKERTGSKPVPVEAAFECQRCGTMNNIPQSDGDFQEPHECVGCERQGPFDINYKQSEWKDVEWLRIQEPPERVQGGEGQDLEVMVDGDIVESANPGDRVTISGTVDVEPPSDNSKTGQFTQQLKGRDITINGTNYEDIDLSPETIDEIREVAAAPEATPYDTLVNSIAPEVHGHDSIKLSIGLQLFGAVRAELPNGSEKRADSHILLMGDPGTAKSLLLRTAEDIAPRSAYASGKGASQAGLTAAAMSSDSTFSGSGMTLEAGALVLANKGLAAVDEIDKISDEVSSAMHGAMSLQRVEVNKGPFDTTLPSKTAVLAAGNPKFGRYDQHEPIGEQVELPGALLSRFDLIWAMEDRPNEDDDTNIAEHIGRSWQVGTEIAANERSDDESFEDLEPEVDKDFLRSWIAYAKQNCQPVVTEDVMEHIRDFYVNLRLSAGSDAAVPITSRKLDGMYRLSMSSARVRLGDTVTMDDAERACGLVQESMRQIGVDPETGQFDADVVETGMSTSQRKRIKRVKALIMEVEEEFDNGAPIEEVKERAEALDVDPEKVEKEIEKLRRKGDVYEPSSDHYRTTE